MDDFFSFVSKAVIVIPIFILIISLFIKFNRPKMGLTNQQTGLVNQTPTGIPITKKNDFKLNLQGPIVCDNLFILNKKVLFKNKTINYLLNGDCMYIWETGKTNGEKKCQLSNYVNMAENYLGFLSMDDLINNNLIKDKIKNKDIDLAKVVKSCKMREIKDKTIFEIPKKIVFAQ
ncbi:MAG: hypothetical protein WCT22_03120 [Patescibacteria group bacterium]